MVIELLRRREQLRRARFPFLYDKLTGKKKDLRAVAVEPTSCPTLTKGEFRYDFGDVAGFTPLMTMYTLGHDFMPSGIHAGGLRYRGDSPLVSQLYHDRIIEAELTRKRNVLRRQHCSPVQKLLSPLLKAAMR